MGQSPKLPHLNQSLSGLTQLHEFPVLLSILNYSMILWWYIAIFMRKNVYVLNCPIVFSMFFWSYAWIYIFLNTFWVLWNLLKFDWAAVKSTFQRIWKGIQLHSLRTLISYLAPKSIINYVKTFFPPSILRDFFSCLFLLSQNSHNRNLYHTGVVSLEMCSQ